MFRFILVLTVLFVSGCQANDTDRATLRANAAAEQDQECQSFGAKKGSPEYIRCRETLYTSARQQDAQRRQAAAAYFMNRPQQQIQPYQMAVPRSVNCTSMQNGVMTNTTCY